LEEFEDLTKQEETGKDELQKKIDNSNFEQAVISFNH
jgi:hypothetical protein